MIATLLTIAGIVPLLFASQWWWKSHLNPVTIGILAWTPGLIMLNWPPFFLSPVYIHLNRPVSPLLYLALALGFLSFWAGCAAVRALSHPSAFRLDPARVRAEFGVARMYVLMTVGLLVYANIYANSGLLELQYMDELGILESRERLHVGLLSFLILFLDVTAIAFFSRFMQKGGGLHYLVPVILALICELATLQKSRFLLLVFGCVFVAALHPRMTYNMFLSSFGRRALTIGLAVLGIAALFAINAVRGISAVQMTAASGPIIEQIYIYSGAAAMQNVSVTIEGYLPSDTPTMGAYLARPLLWHIVDRDLFFVSRYFEGINSATYLIYGWADFRWLGFILTPFLQGVAIMLFLRMALSGSVLGLVLGVIQMRAVIFSPATDVIFDPTTWTIIGFAVVTQVFTYSATAVARKRALIGAMAMDDPAQQNLGHTPGQLRPAGAS